MDTQRYPHLFVSIFFILCLTACTAAPAVTPYLPPTSAPRLTLPTPPISSPKATSTLPAGMPTPVCWNNLTFLDDLTLPDYTSVAPGSRLDKQWLVQNSGSCDWSSAYRLRFIGGYPLGATEEQTLIPARAGTEAVIRIRFTAPAEAGEYTSLWQAYDPSGVAFGEAFLMKIIVQP